MVALDAPVSASATRRRISRRQKFIDFGPMVGMAIAVVLSVGYGLGSLAQFERDWRTSTPVAVQSVTGTPLAGESLPAAISTLLDGSADPVEDVTCATALTADAMAGDQLCYGRAAAGQMVSILASQTAGGLRVTVFAGQ